MIAFRQRDVEYARGTVVARYTEYRIFRGANSRFADSRYCPGTFLQTAAMTVISPRVTLAARRGGCSSFFGVAADAAARIGRQAALICSSSSAVETGAIWLFLRGILARIDGRRSGSASPPAQPEAGD